LAAGTRSPICDSSDQVLTAPKQKSFDIWPNKKARRQNRGPWTYDGRPNIQNHWFITVIKKRDMCETARHRVSRYLDFSNEAHALDCKFNNSATSADPHCSGYQISTKSNSSRRSYWDLNVQVGRRPPYWIWLKVDFYSYATFVMDHIGQTYQISTQSNKLLSWIIG